MKKNKLKIIELKKAPIGEVRQHLSKCIENLFANSSPVVGYALVTFHENKSYGTSHHLTKSGIHQVDMPEMIKNRLLVNVIKDS